MINRFVRFIEFLPNCRFIIRLGIIETDHYTDEILMAANTSIGNCKIMKLSTTLKLLILENSIS